MARFSHRIVAKFRSVATIVGLPFIPAAGAGYALYFWPDTPSITQQPDSICPIVASYMATPPAGSLLARLEIPSEPDGGRCDKQRSWREWNEEALAAGDFRAVGRQRFIALIRTEAERNGLPGDVADAVTYVESGYDPESVGGVGEIGLMQVRPGTALLLGFRGSDAELAVPETNIRYGVKYLARAWRLAEGDLCRALMKYRAGHGEEKMTLRSIEYCNRVKNYLRRSNSPLSASISSRDALIPSAETLKFEINPRPVKIAARSKKIRDPARFWAAHTARIQLLTKQVHAKWRRIAQSRKTPTL